MGSADYFADGQWNFYCDLCGRKAKSSTAMKTWDGHYVCQRHKEVRNPQDFIRAVADNQSVPWDRSKPPEIFVGDFCTQNGRSAIADYAVADCAVADYVSAAFDPAATPIACIPLVISAPTTILGVDALWVCSQVIIDSDLTIDGTLGIY